MIGETSSTYPCLRPVEGTNHGGALVTHQCDGTMRLVGALDEAPIFVCGKCGRMATPEPSTAD